MQTMQNLYEIINSQKDVFKKTAPEAIAIPAYISNNLKHSFFNWQTEALENLHCYEHPELEYKTSPTHLIFNMATGTGKTLLMAATMLYYYQQGYRYFLFFVNQNNIVDKTENNFIDNTHTKYLFTEKIIMADKTVAIKKVETFSDHPQGIEIKFTTIQKLYNDIHLQRENQTTLDDLHSRNIVMLADEAHHLNANTKNIAIQCDSLDEKLKGSKDEIEKKGWEHTVIDLILNKNASKKANKNILLEFTATIPDTANVAEKYANKIIYKFALKEFLQAGYTKEINLISSTLNKKERVFQALLFQWYRHIIAIKYGIANFKPVILFRSKTIAESKADYEEFLNWIDDVSNRDLKFIKTITDGISGTENSYAQGKSRTEQLLQYIKEQNIHHRDICNWIKQNFAAKNVIITNSQNNRIRIEKTDEETEKLLNSLEDKNNHIRAIFTVQRLTEGWDVLNLFDIVRLYEGRDESKDNRGQRIAGSATIAEKQLIGRGVRYFPFAYGDKIKNKRKFDADLQHELRVLEELYFYSTSDHRYIDELKRELRKDGYISDDRQAVTFSLKENFKDSNFYKNVNIWYNKQIDNPNRKRKTLDDIKQCLNSDYKIKGLEVHEQTFAAEQQDDHENLTVREGTQHTITRKFKEIEGHIVRKAINIKAKQENSLYQFSRLKEELEIESMDDLQTDKLAEFKINITIDADMGYDDIGNSEKLNMVMKFLDKFAVEFKKGITSKKGTEKFFAATFGKFFAEPKTKIIHRDIAPKEIAKNLAEQDWYVLDQFYGTDEEEALIQFITNNFGNLKSKYDPIYLLRNEEIYKIYDFEKGQGFQPDFLLFLRSKVDKIVYQAFIETKGNQFADNNKDFQGGKEGWKEKFLNEISEKYGFDKLIKAENKDYRLIGFPFFNQAKESGS